MKQLIHAGRDYGRRTIDGPLEPVSDADGRPPDVWICRRVADFPAGRVPAGGAVDRCGDCGADVVFNPQRQVPAPKQCMQCAGIKPLPIEER